MSPAGAAAESRIRSPSRLDVLLNDDGVGAVGHRRAGEDAHRLARTDSALESAAGGGFADHRQGRGRRRRIGRAHRVAVHGGVGKRRLGAQRLKVAREHAAISRFKSDLFLLERRLGGGEHARQRLLDRDHWRSSALVLRLVVARHSPDLPPRFSISLNRLDAHAPVDRLGHVVDGEAGDGNGGQRLHLDAGRADASRLGPNGKAGQRVVGRNVDRNLGQGQRDGRAE